MSSSTRGVVRFSLSLPPTLVKDFDETCKNVGYDNRSKAAHDAFCSFLSEHKWTRGDEEIAGAIVIAYYLDKPNLLSQIMEIQHRFENVVSSTMHIHLIKNKCLELIAVRGNASNIRKLSQELVTLRGVKGLKLALIAT
jgi:CopG family nickel-responsive transcriptional regulator